MIKRQNPLEQFRDLENQPKLSKSRLNRILGKLDTDGYKSVGGVLPIQEQGTDAFLSSELRNITTANHLEKNPEKRRQKIGDFVIGPYVTKDENGKIVYEPAGRMVYEKAGRILDDQTAIVIDVGKAEH